MLDRRRKFPTRVLRGSSFVAWALSALSLTRMVRNFQQVNSLPIYPVRRCLKNIGPGDDSLMAIVTGISTTGEAISTTELIAMSQTRFIERLTTDVSGLLRVDNTGTSPIGRMANERVTYRLSCGTRKNWAILWSATRIDSPMALSSSPERV